MTFTDAAAIASAGRAKRFDDHPDRALAQAEVHARPVQPIGAPARVRRVAFFLGHAPGSSRSAVDRFATWLHKTGLPALRGEDRNFNYRVDNRSVVWELHNEFVTFTWISEADDRDAWPIDIGLDAYGGEKVIVAVRVDVADRAALAPDSLASFNPVSLCYSRIDDGAAELATDFLPDGDGFNLYEFAAGGIGAIRRGILVRRVLEIETYRILSLMGLPLARVVSPQIRELETRLAQFLGRMGSAATTTADNRAALDELHALSLRAGQIVEDTRYRFAASKAYGAILWSRLDRLGERSMGDFNTLQRFLAHRIEPALATGVAIEKRQETLALRLAQTTELLNTRINVDVQIQNQGLLNAISRTAKSQYQLQTTVEGLSTIAISYYLLAILGYVFHGLEGVIHIEKDIAVAAIAPVVVLGVWWSVRRIRLRHSDSA